MESVLYEIPLPDLETAKRHLHTRGFAVFAQFARPETIERMEREIARLMAGHTSNQQYGLMRDAHGHVVVMNGLCKVSDFFFDLARHPDVVNVANFLVGKRTVPLHTEYFAKPAMYSVGTPPHQDQAFYYEHFDDELAISLWVALDDVTENSGALEFVPTSVQTLLPHTQSQCIGFDRELAEAVDDLPFERVTVLCGGCVVHHAYTIHRTAPNRSNRPRRAVVFNYRGSEYREWLAHRGSND